MRGEDIFKSPPCICHKPISDTINNIKLADLTKLGIIISWICLLNILGSLFVFYNLLTWVWIIILVSFRIESFCKYDLQIIHVIIHVLVLVKLRCWYYKGPILASVWHTLKCGPISSSFLALLKNWTFDFRQNWYLVSL